MNQKSRFQHLFTLILILAGGTMTMLLLDTNRGAQLVVGIVTSVAYVVWGIIHHALEGDLHRKVVVEYALMGVIAVILLMTVLGS